MSSTLTSVLRRTYVHLWLIHVDVWQKTKFYKAITLQLKNKKETEVGESHVAMEAEIGMIHQKPKGPSPAICC